MTRNRRRIDIIADVLKAAGNNTVKKTRIMHFANLSYELLEKYLAEVLTLGFIRSNNDGYEVTEKGRIFLEKYRELYTKYARVERELEKLSFERETLERMCAVPGKADPKVEPERVKK